MKNNDFKTIILSSTLESHCSDFMAETQWCHLPHQMSSWGESCRDWGDGCIQAYGDK